MIDQTVLDRRVEQSTKPFRNHILAGLTRETHYNIVLIHMAQGQALVERGGVLQYVFFIESGLVCFSDGERGDIAPQTVMVGADGAVGLLELVSGASIAFATAIVQVRGEAVRMDISDAARVLNSQDRRSPADADAADLARLSVQALIRQALETAAANARDSLVQRLVRWLLMARTLLATNEIPITHEVLSTLLGVRRAGVTVAVTALQMQKLVRANRGRITLLDVDGLVRLNARRPKEQVSGTASNICPG